jgi:hypothetical protein
MVEGEVSVGFLGECYIYYVYLFVVNNFTNGPCFIPYLRFLFDCVSSQDKLSLSFSFVILRLQSALLLIRRSSRSRSWAVFCSNVGVVGSNPAKGNWCQCAFILCLCCPCMYSAALHQSDLPSKKSYRLCIGLTNWKEQRYTVGCRAIIIQFNSILYYLCAESTANNNNTNNIIIINTQNKLRGL